MAKKSKYIAMVETHRNGYREQWAEGADGHSLSGSGRWTDARLRDSKKEALAEAKKIAAGFNANENAEAFVRTVTIEVPASKPAAQRSQKSKSKTGAKVQSRKAEPTAPKSSSSFTVKVGRTTRTFATKAEAQAFAQQCKSRNVSITPSTRKPTHKVVSFTARK